jgi:predicted NBD/HSP70 family sugar kinase
VRDSSPIARKEISHLSHLSIATTKRLIEELLGERLIVEGGRSSNLRGRKASLLRLNREYGYTVGVNIIPGALEIAALSFAGDIVHRREITGLQPERNAILPLLKEEITRIIEKEGHRKHGALLGIGIGIAGLVNTRKGMVLFTPNMGGWEEAALGEELSRSFGSAVIIDDSVRCMALAEKRYGTARKLENFLYIYIGKGVGSGFLLDGRIYRGAHGVAGEFGHITIRQNGNICNCGNRGCLEAHVSESRIIEEVERQIASKVHSTLAALHEHGDGIKLGDIRDHARRGDKLANLTLNNVSENIGVGIADLVNVFDPGVIILGGEVFDTFGDEVCEGIMRTVKLKSLNTISSRTSIVRTGVQELAASRGAATLPLEKYLQNGILNIET